MSAAAFTIIYMRIIIEWRVIIFGSIGAAFGIIFGFYFIDPLLDAHQKKMAFVSIWFSFAIALYLLNRQKKRITFDRIQNFDDWWKAGVVMATGFFGG